MVLFVCSFSDGTLNPSGVRFGSAEIYNIGNIKLYHCLALSLFFIFPCFYPSLSCFLSSFTHAFML